MKSFTPARNPSGSPTRDAKRGVEPEKTPILDSITPEIKGAILVMGIVVAYWLAGKYGYLLEIQPGTAGNLRPTAGIALAILLVFGLRRWPALLTGSFLVHTLLYFNFSESVLPGNAVALSASLATGDTLQAFIGTCIIQRQLGRNLDLLANRDIISLLLIGGPICCVLGAFWHSVTLSTLAPLPEDNLSLTWLSWWSGNVISVALLTPLALCIICEQKFCWTRRRWSLAFPLCIALLAIAASNTYVRFQEQKQIELDFNQHAATTANSVEIALVRYLDVLQSLGSLYTSSDNISREKFRQFTAPALSQFDGIQALSWNPLVTKNQRADLEAQTRAEGFDQFQITQRDPTGQLLPAEDRTEYIVVHYIEPFAGNESALGFDVASNPVRQQTLAASRDSGKLLATAPINLVQEAGSQSGILAFLPVFSTGTVPQTLYEKRAALEGFVVGVFRLGDVMASALQDTAPNNTVVRLYDSSGKGLAAPLATYRIDKKGKGELVENQVKELQNSNLSWSSSTNMAGRHWRIVIEPSADYLSAQQSSIAGLLTLAGPLIALLVSAFLLVITGRNAKLAVSNEALESEITERRQAEGKLFREKKKAQITLASIGDAVITTDANHLIESLNPIAEDLTGWSSEAARGQKLAQVYSITARTNQFPDDLQLNYDFTDLFAPGLANNAFLTHQSGKVFSILESRTPIKDNEGIVYGSVIVFGDVSEQHRLTSQISYRASHDDLTGLINRQEFERRLEESLLTVVELGFNHTLCYLDLDAFKTVNDTSGHTAGDELLRQIAELFKSHIRHGDALGRLGGDEFGLLLEHCTLKNAERLCNELRKSLENYQFQWEGRTFRIGVSIGLAHINSKTASMADLLSRADGACYAAKNSGKNRVHCALEFNPATGQKTEKL